MSPSDHDDVEEFGRYELLELVGEGAMAQVFRAQRVGGSGFRKEVAIKRLRPGTMGRDERMQEALINEARNGSLLRHPGIVEIHEFDHVDDEWYLAMEYVHGWTLEEVLWSAASEELPAHLRSETGAAGLHQAVVLDLARQMCHALAHAHEARDEAGRPLGLVHRDLKPANVFLARTGLVKLADFGLAKSRANLRQTTDADRTKGSPLYMSPEQVGGVAVDGRSDLFALGTLIVELCVGATPFEGATVANTLVRVMEVDWTEVEALMAQRAPALLPLVQRLLQKDPRDRYPSARALAAELDQFAAGQPIGAHSTRLAKAMNRDDPAADMPPPPVGESTAGMSIVESGPSGGWGLLVALLLVLGVLMAAVIWVLRMPGTSGGGFAGMRAPVAEELGSDAAPPLAVASATASSGAFTHVPVTEAGMWQDMELRAERAGKGSWDVRVAYRVPDSDWRLLPLSCIEAQCAASLPITSDAGLDYYLVATGPGGEEWGFGSEQSPVTVSVR